MKKMLLLLLFVSSQTFAHDLNYDHVMARNWQLSEGNKTIKGFFHNANENTVFIEKENGEMASFLIASLSQKDQAFIVEKKAKIEAMNQQIVVNQDVSKTSCTSLFLKSALFLTFLFGFGKWMAAYSDKKTMRLTYAILSIFAVFSLYSFTKKALLGSDPKVIDEAFKPFKPNVYTRWDATYFYVESNGIPTTHDMMTGITGWQQQVPIPQCYTGSNAWSIPLNPVLATTPVPVNAQHFLKGAVAIAANGIAIFNPYTNTGVDAFLDGQLDKWGGHCGRADDYHYHTAPLHLYGTTTATLPIAYALDGFAIYGSKEPDGAAMKPLDTNHGHNGTDGVYHYHGTTNAPYMIGNMVGKVTEDANLQIIPQAAAKPVRPAGAPLKGAMITGCVPNAAKNGYTLSYTLSGQTYKWIYNWDAVTGKYTFLIASATGTTTTNYNGYVACVVKTTATKERLLEDNAIAIFPNPNDGILNLQLSENVQFSDVQHISIFDLKGRLMYKNASFIEKIDLKNAVKGIYVVKIQCANGLFVKKVVLEN
jgi:hypothetical protein